MKKVAMLLITSMFALVSGNAMAGYYYKDNRCCHYDNDWVYHHIKTRCVHAQPFQIENWEHHHKGHRFHVHGGVLAPVDAVVKHVRRMPSMHHHHMKKHHHMKHHHMHHKKRYHREHCLTCKTYWH